MKKISPLFTPLALALIACQQASIPESDQTLSASSSSSISSVMAAIKIDTVSSSSISQKLSKAEQHSSTDAIPISNEQWRDKLSPEQYAVLRENGTEQPFTSELLDEHRAGTFVTADCGDPVFRSEQKFDSGTGWPSFWALISPNAVIEVPDTTYGIQRTAIVSRCGGHLGHVFTDGPEPTGLRYCMNGVALKFIPDDVQP